MEELLNQQWRSHVRSNIAAADLAREIETLDWNGDNGWSWCVEMALDAGGVPRVMADHGPCSDDDLPDGGDGVVVIACPLAEHTIKQDLIEFDAAAEVDWEHEWNVTANEEDEND